MPGNRRRRAGRRREQQQPPPPPQPVLEPELEPEPEPEPEQRRHIRSLAELEVEGRTGRRSNPGGGYYGCNSAVFNVHPRGAPGERLALKVVYNVQEVDTINLEEHFSADYNLFLDENNEESDRLPPHPGILRVLSHFTDRASQRTLGPSWNVDSEFTREGSLCVLMERMDGSLKSLLSDRYATTERQLHARLSEGQSAALDSSDAGKRTNWAFFSPAEFFTIATQLSSAVTHLWAHGIVHRDIKPDNLLYRREAPDDPNPDSHICALRFKIADFGEALDAYEFTEPTAPPSFRMPFNAPMPRGGAQHYLPPEIMAEKPGRGKFLDYTASDAWALGMVLYALLSREEPFSVSDQREFSAATYRELSRETCPVDVASVVGELLRVDPAERLSAREANEQLLHLQVAHYRARSAQEKLLAEQAVAHAQEQADARVAAAVEAEVSEMKAQLGALSQQLARQSQELQQQLLQSEQMATAYQDQMSQIQQLGADLVRAEADKATAEAATVDAHRECAAVEAQHAEEIRNVQAALQVAKDALHAHKASAHCDRAAVEKEKADALRQLRSSEERRVAAEADICTLRKEQMTAEPRPEPVAAKPDAQLKEEAVVEEDMSRECLNPQDEPQGDLDPGPEIDPKNVLEPEPEPEQESAKAAPTAPQSTRPYPVGAFAQIWGLQSSAGQSLNGKLCRVGKYDERSMRHLCQLLNMSSGVWQRDFEADRKRVKPQNLRMFDELFIDAAASGIHVELLERLKYGVAIDTFRFSGSRRSPNYGSTALMEAVEGGHQVAALALVHQCANMNLQRADGMTALMLASIKGFDKLSQLMLDPQLPSAQEAAESFGDDGDTAVEEICEVRRMRAQTPTAQPADPNLREKQGGTALHMAAANGHREMVQLLVRHGADPNAAAANGSTALMMAALNQHLPVLQYLLQQVENIKVDLINTTADGKGTTAFHLACANGDLAAVKLLLEAGCNYTMACQHGDRLMNGYQLATACRSPGGEAVAALLVQHLPASQWIQ